MRAASRNAAALKRTLAWERERAPRGSVHAIGAGPIDEALAERLDAFERRVAVRLSEGIDVYRIHGLRDADPNSYYRSIGGRAVTLVAEEHGRVVGTQSLVVKTLRRAGGPPARFVYALNVRVAPECRFGPVFGRLQLAGLAWAASRCWGVLTVIPDLVSTPPRGRSGRFGIPRLRKLRGCACVGFPLDLACSAREADRCVRDEAEVRRLFRRLTSGCVSPVGGTPGARSLGAPVWLALPDASACCCVEDFRRTRRLETLDGTEVVWRCVSFLGAANADAAERMCRVACAHAARIGDEPLRAMVEGELGAALRTSMGLGGSLCYPLSMWGWRLSPREPNVPWVFNLTET